jgi:hypothetical protein
MLTDNITTIVTVLQCQLIDNQNISKEEIFLKFRYNHTLITIRQM